MASLYAPVSVCLWGMCGHLRAYPFELATIKQAHARVRVVRMCMCARRGLRARVDAYRWARKRVSGYMSERMCVKEQVVERASERASCLLYTSPSPRD
eukprot:12603204-Alexandrium_andersonii.AAC.1